MYRRNDGIKELSARLSPADKETFFMDTKAFHWDDFMKFYVLGARRYILKEDDSTLPQTRKIFLIYWLVDGIVRFVLVALFLWFVYTLISPLFSAKTLVGIIEHS